MLPRISMMEFRIHGKYLCRTGRLKGELCILNTKCTTQGRGLPIINVKMIGSMLAKFDIWQSMAWIRRTEHVKVSAG